MTGLLLVLLAFALAWPATAAVRTLALRRELLDRPNARSSHSVPTPRGGGLAFAAVLLLLLPLVAREAGGGRLAFALLLGGLPVALVGLVDDVRDLSARVRASVHAGAAVAAVAVLGVPAFEGAWRLAGGFLLVLALVWLVNLYNFMDGIDGIAGGQAVVAALGLAALTTTAPAVDTAAHLLAGAVLGFLVLNAPPAKIFMGDVGSGFLGLVLGVLVLAAGSSGSVPLPIAGLVLAPFLVDATGTLLLRVVRGERWYEPHRDHLYQRLTRTGLTHRAVSMAYIALSAVLALEAVLLGDSPWAVHAAVATLVLLAAVWLLARFWTREAASTAG